MVHDILSDDGKGSRCENAHGSPEVEPEQRFLLCEKEAGECRSFERVRYVSSIGRRRRAIIGYQGSRVDARFTGSAYSIRWLLYIRGKISLDRRPYDPTYPHCFRSRCSLFIVPLRMWRRP